MMEKTSLEKKVLSSNEWGLIALLNEGLIEIFQEAAEAIKREDFEELNKITNNCRDILTELLVTFREKDDLSTNLRSLYLYTNTLITEAEIKKDGSYYIEAIDIIKPLYAGFKSLEMKEKPNIISGLLYGKDDLEEFKQSDKVFEG